MTTMKEHRAELVTALRSNKYKQGAGVLRTAADEFCCLGVASNLINSTKWKQIENDPDKNHYRYTSGSDSSTALLTKDIQKKYGFVENDGAFFLDSLSKELLEKIRDCKTGPWQLRHATLTSLNDRGIPFNLIADVIEEEPEGMFNI